MQFTQFAACRADTGAVLPYARCTVYLTGTSTKASLYLADGVTAASNPAIADVTGVIGFAVPDGVYDLSIASADNVYTAPTLTGFPFVTPGNYQGDSATLLQLKKASGTPAFTFSSLGAVIGNAGTTATGGEQMIIGTNTPSGDLAAINICRGLSGSNLFYHGLRDESTVTSTGTIAYACVDAAATMNSSIHGNHYRMVQARGTYNGTGGGNLDEFNGFGFEPLVTGGNVGEMYGLHISNAALSGGATITGQQTGVYIEALSGAVGGNYGLFVNGNDNILLGNLQIAGSILGATTITGSGQFTGAAMIATGIPASYANGAILSGAIGAAGYGGLQAYNNASGSAKGLAIQSAGGQVIIGAAVPASGGALEVAGSIMPHADNISPLGSASFRFSQLFAGTATISTSDARHKTDIGAIPDAWLDAWGDVDRVRYKFADGTRWHVGLTAQGVRDAFAKHGIDATTIGLLCYDKWEDAHGDVMETAEVAPAVMSPEVRTPRYVHVPTGILSADSKVLMRREQLEDHVPSAVARHARCA